MADIIKMKKSDVNEVARVDLHDSSPNFVNSKTLSRDTMPKGKMTYTPGDNSIKIERDGSTFFLPITNVKLIWMKS